MRNKHNNRILGRNAHQRRYLMRNLTSALLLHGSIVTTEAKGKELKRFVEPMITKAKNDNGLAVRRALLANLHDKSDFVRLQDIAKEYAKRPGGYLRLTRLPLSRSDAAREVRVEFVETEGKK